MKEGVLDLGSAASAPVIDLVARYPHRGLAAVVFAAYLLLGLGVLRWLIRRATGRSTPAPAMSEWPQSLKALSTLGLIAFGGVHVFALLEVYLQSRVNFTSAEEYFFYMSPAKLAATSHAHLFGHAVMYGLTGFLFTRTSVGERWKTAIIALTLAGGLLDVPSWWMLKYAGGRFEIFSVLAAGLSSFGFLIMAGRILFEMWNSKFKVQS